MINLIDIRYVRMGTDDIERCVDFATRMVGLQVVRRDENAAYVRGDDRDHNIVYFKGDPSDHTLGLEVRTVEELAAASAELEAAGHAVRQGTDAEAAERRVLRFATFKDPTGNKVDLVVRPYHSGERYYGARDAGIQDFSHVGLKSSNAPRDEAFWCKHFNMRVNDWIGPAPLMSFDHVHHRVALFPTDRPGIQHINFQVNGIDDIMKSWYFLQKHQVKIMFGPGRHPSSSAMFLYFEGPGRIIYEYSHGVRHLHDGDGWRARQFPFEQYSFCMWGAVPQIEEFDTVKK
ncbi:MAG: VOC family protein [Alphaproteobacteria bacterium]